MRLLRRSKRFVKGPFYNDTAISRKIPSCDGNATYSELFIAYNKLFADNRVLILIYSVLFANSRVLFIIYSTLFVAYSALSTNSMILFIIYSVLFVAYSALFVF